MIWGVLLIVLGLVIAIPFAREEMRDKMDDDRRQGVNGHFVRLSQGVTYYDWIGPLRGPVAVCVHGLTTPSFVWRGLAHGLGQMGYRVLIYDLYGRGYSDHLNGPQTRDFFLTQLNELLDDQGIEQDITLIGYSMGGAIATTFAATHPGRIRQLILLAPAGMAVNRGRLGAFIKDTPVIGDWLMLAIFPLLHRLGINKQRKLPSSVGNICDLQKAELKIQGFTPAVLASNRDMPLDNLEVEHRAIHRANIPVLAVWGRVDDVIPLTAVGLLSEWNRSARQEVIDGAGHGLVYTDTDAVLDALSEVLQEGLNS